MHDRIYTFLSNLVSHDYFLYIKDCDLGIYKISPFEHALSHLYSIIEWEKNIFPINSGFSEVKYTSSLFS